MSARQSLILSMRHSSTLTVLRPVILELRNTKHVS